MSDQRTVLVAGATGNQGSAVVEALLGRGHKVIALTRNPDSDRAKRLADRGVNVAVGDFADFDSLVRAAAGADTVYAMTTPYEAGIESETKRGLSLVNAVQAAGVGHLIFGSVASAEQNTGIPHFDSKYEVEMHLASLGLPHTIVAPVFFMDNLLSPWFLPTLREGKLAMALPAERRLQQVALSTIGAFAAALVERREAVFGKRFNIAGDELTGTEAAAVLSRVTRREIHFEGFPPDVLRADSEDMALMFEWFDRIGYSANIEGLRHEFPDVPWLSFENWASKQDWSILG